MQIIATVTAYLLARLRSERGQDLLEYALLGGLIAAAIVVVIGLGIMTGAVSSMTQGIADCIDFVKSSPCGPF